MNSYAQRTPARLRQSARPRPPLALAGICLGFLMITLDATIVNVALGPIVADLGGSLSGAQWIVSAYTLAFATLLLSAGALADRIGARRAYLLGLGIFALGSAACAVAPSLDGLIAARGLQGIGAAFLMPCSLALVTHAFPSGAERHRALGVWGGVSGIGLAGGPVLGGILVAAVGWRAIFLVNLPFALLAAVLVRAEVAETPRSPHRLDPLGQVLGIGSIGALVAGLILAGERGWTAAATVGLLAAGVLLSLGFVVAERLGSHPMVPLGIFRRRGFTLAVAIAGLFNFCLYGSLFCLALVLHIDHGLSALRTGLALLPVTALIGVTAFLSPRAITRIGEWPAVVAGLAAAAAGAALTAIAADGAAPLIVIAGLPLGLVALAMPAMTALAMKDAPNGRVGIASGVQNAARQAGGAFGVAALGSILATSGGMALRSAMIVVAVAYLLALGLAVMGMRADAG